MKDTKNSSKNVAKLQSMYFGEKWVLFKSNPWEQVSSPKTGTAGWLVLSDTWQEAAGASLGEGEGQSIKHLGNMASSREGAFEDLGNMPKCCWSWMNSTQSFVALKYIYIKHFLKLNIWKGKWLCEH